MKQCKQPVEQKKDYPGGSQGSVTVFFVVILLSVILLTGSTVDLARIQVADNKMDSAMRAATKSLLSEYNTDLLGAYGIFACEPDKSALTFEKYLKENLELSSNGFIKYTYEPNSGRIEGNGEATIADNDVLERQIKDYMGTKKAVNKGERVLDRVLSGINTMLSDNDLEGMMKNTSKESDKLLDDEGPILKKEGAQTDDNTARELQHALNGLEEDFEQIESSGEKVFDDFAEGAFAQNYEQREMAETYEAGSRQRKKNLEEIRETTKKMVGLAEALSDLREALDRELSREEPDFDRVAELQRQIGDAEREYDLCRERVKEIRESEGTKKEVVKNGPEYDFSMLSSIMAGASDFKMNFPELSGSSTSADTNIPAGANALFKTFTRQAEKLAVFNLADAADKDTVMEYVLDRCTYATSGTDRELSYFLFGETEYIIHGGQNQLNNLMLTAVEIFLFCYVVNAVDLMLSSVPPFPTALVLAVPYAFESLHELLDGGKYLPFEMLITKGAGARGADTAKEAIGLQYSDFLYFQLAAVDKNDMLNRLRRLMLANINEHYKTTGQDRIAAQNLHTEVSAVAGARINLLFLPMFSLDSLGIDNFSGTEYTIVKKYKYTYQLTPEKQKENG